MGRKEKDEWRQKQEYEMNMGKLFRN